MYASARTKKQTKTNRHFYSMSADNLLNNYKRMPTGYGSLGNRAQELFEKERMNRNMHWYKHLVEVVVFPEAGNYDGNKNYGMTTQPQHNY